MADLGFWAIAADDPGHLALVEADGRETSAGDLLAGANQVARGLQAAGLEKGDAVAALLPNEREMIELALGATQIGLYLTPINYHLVGPEIAYILHDCEAQVFVVHERYAEVCRLAVEETRFPADRVFSVGRIDGPRFQVAGRGIGWGGAAPAAAPVSPLARMEVRSVEEARAAVREHVEPKGMRYRLDQRRQIAALLRCENQWLNCCR